MRRRIQIASTNLTVIFVDTMSTSLGPKCSRFGMSLEFGSYCEVRDNERMKQPTGEQL